MSAPSLLEILVFGWRRRRQARPRALSMLMIRGKTWQFG